jgi:hypothetical protein
MKISKPFCDHLKYYWSEIYFEQTLYEKIMYVRPEQQVVPFVLRCSRLLSKEYAVRKS